MAYVGCEKCRLWENLQTQEIVWNMPNTTLAMMWSILKHKNIC
ncbi:unnamed protein product [Musa acuminata subsp. malaccensis]|uniref:(wild Malaysian banana) hypothetical protein n=1 Tax=Musa acuminata subsp. malaccensis TaxID=214687 RepID=A0A804HMG5_MUSAM|nr:unnamed protein product [Musa acuminata subsp. malaccensis]